VGSSSSRPQQQQPARANRNGNEWKSFVPKEAHEFFEKGRVVLAQEHLSDYDGIFDTEIPFPTFDKFCSAKAKDRAPSVSNVRIDHVCSAQIRERKLICKILSLPYLTGRTFSSWDHEIINWIPKEPGNPAIDRRRPIALLEVLRKVTLGVKKQQVFDVWEKHNLIDKGNFAFMPGKFISDPILIKRLLLEDAVWLEKQLITLDVDYKAAFDKVPYFIKEMSLRRMGMPERGIDLWCAHDQTRIQHVRTAYGLTKGTHPRCGAFGQGAEESPMGFVSLMSWKCDYIFASDCNVMPYNYTSHGEDMLKLCKTIFCDDSSYTTSSFEGARNILRRIGIFAAASGMELNIKKTFYVGMDIGKNEDTTLRIPMPVFDVVHYESTGEYQYVSPMFQEEIKEESPDFFWRHLGNYQSNNGSSVPLNNEINKIIHEGLTYMAGCDITSDGALMGYHTGP